MISLGHRGSVPVDERVRAIHVECSKEDHLEVKVALARIYCSDKNEDYSNGVQMRLVPEMNVMISPETRQNCNHLRARRSNFAEKVDTTLTYDIIGLDYIDLTIGRSLREIVMKIGFCTVPEQQLFHSVDVSWNGSGVQFCLVPNVKEKARAMIIVIVPFAQYNYGKWFSGNAISKAAAGATWDPAKGCVHTSDDAVISWYMTEGGGFGRFTVEDEASPGTTFSTRPDPANLQAVAEAAGAGLIAADDSVVTFENHHSTTRPVTAGSTAPGDVAPAQLVTGVRANPIPRTLTTSALDEHSASSRSTRSSITVSLYS